LLADEGDGGSGPTKTTAKMVDLLDYYCHGFNTPELDVGKIVQSHRVHKGWQWPLFSHIPS
jgi:hypothetical protein